MQKSQKIAEDETPSSVPSTSGSNGARNGETSKVVLRAGLGPREAGRLEEALDRLRREEQAEIEQAEEEQRLEKERRRSQQEERNRIQRETDWEQFMQRERREIDLRRDGQLANLLGEPIAREPAAALKRLAEEDQRQAEQGLVALMSGGELRYKPLDDLSPEDMPARAAAERLRTTWLKERRDGWLAQGENQV